MQKTGTVKWFSDRMGYGFITPGGAAVDEPDVFVHQRAIEAAGYRTLTAGQRVKYTAVPTVKGIQAREVRVIGSGAAAIDEYQPPLPFGAGPPEPPPALADWMVEPRPRR